MLLIFEEKLLLLLELPFHFAMIGDFKMWKSSEKFSLQQLYIHCPSSSPFSATLNINLPEKQIELMINALTLMILMMLVLKYSSSCWMLIYRRMDYHRPFHATISKNNILNAYLLITINLNENLFRNQWIAQQQWLKYNWNTHANRLGMMLFIVCNLHEMYAVPRYV